MDAYGKALLQEAACFKESDKKIRMGTLYVGGGTPSLLPVSFYVGLYGKLASSFDFSSLEEATFEANPEHLTQEYLRDLLRYTPFRRLSIGVQSFFDADLKALNRRHTAKEALAAIDNARKAGWENITIDLIYGLHSAQDMSGWQKNLEQLKSLNLPHFSAYALTVEPGTMLEKRISQGRMRVASEMQIEREYFYLQEFAAANGYEAYEISNYAQKGAYALHNCNYWRDVPYIGLGASAHSYMEGHRYWNPSSLTEYLQNPVEAKQGELLSEEDRYHEYIMTALRTQWGVSKEKIDTFSESLRKEFYTCAGQEMKIGNLVRQGDAYIVPLRRRLLTDGIAASFF